jgi:hypothetical protein
MYVNCTASWPLASRFTSLGFGGQAADEVTHLVRSLARGVIHALAEDHDDRRQPDPQSRGHQRLGCRCHQRLARLGPTMALVGFTIAPVSLPEMPVTLAA